MKTNFLNKMKQFLFLFAATLGMYAGYSQSTHNPIGGKSSDGGLGSLNDIGGSQGTPRDTGGMIVLLPETKTVCRFATLKDIGGSNSGGRGTSTDTGQIGALNYSSAADIGGGKSTDGGLNTGLPILVIGGRDSGTGLLVSPSNLNCTETCLTIGGKDSGGGLANFEASLFDIGGKSTGGDLPLGDIGGKGGRGSDTGTGQISFDNLTS